jgi:hypothetical protein
MRTGNYLAGLSTVRDLQVGSRDRVQYRLRLNGTAGPDAYGRYQRRAGMTGDGTGGSYRLRQ